MPESETIGAKEKGRRINMKNRHTLIPYTLETVARRVRAKVGCADRRRASRYAMKEVERMKKDKQAYAELVKKLSPKSDMAKGVWRAFAVGGLICIIGQAINDVFSYGLKWGTQSAATSDEHLSGVSIRPADRLGRL